MGYPRLQYRPCGRMFLPQTEVTPEALAQKAKRAWQMPHEELVKDEQAMRDFLGWFYSETGNVGMFQRMRMGDKPIVADLARARRLAAERFTLAESDFTPTISLLAKVEGNPIRKFCCRLCGECAPKELLEEGRFPDRIAWLRHHYKEKHPSTWGKLPVPPQTEFTPEEIALLDPKRFPKRTEALYKLKGHDVVHVHDDGDLTVRSQGRLYVVTTEGQVFEQKEYLSQTKNPMPYTRGKFKPEEIDPAIRDVVSELNERGYETESSCAGHKADEEGVIGFTEKYPHQEIIKILKKHGLSIKGIEDTSNPWFPQERTVITFEPLGGESISIPDRARIAVIPKKSEVLKWAKAQGYDREITNLMLKTFGYKKESSEDIGG